MQSKGRIQKALSSTNSFSSAEAEEKKPTDAVMNLVYKYAEEAILKGIAIGSKTFKNYIKNRVNLNNTPDGIIEDAIEVADYSQLKERYIKNGKLIAKESQKYTLTIHAEERFSKPDLENVTELFNKYKTQAQKVGIKGEKELLTFLKEKIQPRNISDKAVADVIDTGKCTKLPGKKAKYTKDGSTVIVSRRDHSIITGYKDHTNKNPHTLHKPLHLANSSESVSTDSKQAESSIMPNQSK